MRVKRNWPEGVKAGDLVEVHYVVRHGAMVVPAWILRKVIRVFDDGVLSIEEPNNQRRMIRSDEWR